MNDASSKSLLFFCIAVAHGAVFYAILTFPTARRLPTESIAGTLLFVESPVRRRRADLSEVKRIEKTSRVKLRLEAKGSPRASAVDTAISVPPPIDWVAERERAATESASKQARGESRSLLSRPKSLEMPNRGDSFEPGDSRHFDTGEIITSLDDDCHVTNMSAPGPRLDPNAIHVVCKNAHKPVTTDVFDFQKPSRLRDPSAPQPKFKGIFRDDAKCEYSSVRCD